VSSRSRLLRTLLTGERGHRQIRLVEDPLRGEVVVPKTAPTDSAAAIALLSEGALHAGLAQPPLVPVVWGRQDPTEAQRQGLGTAGWHLAQIAGDEALEPEAFEVSPRATC
jgi:hypothetical protein